MKKRIVFAAVLLVLFALPAAVLAQSGDLGVRLTRDWGYGGGGGQIQGTFSLHAADLPELVQVDFIIDGVVVFTDTEPPYRYQFKTEEYAPGHHSMTAIGIKSDGVRIEGRTFERYFLTADEAMSATKGIVLPILVVVGVVSAMSILGPLVLWRKQTHKPGVYGSAGGAICPRCTFPYSRHLLAPNMLVGKLERCPHCGKWAIVRAASRFDLEAAEARLAAASGPQDLPPEDEQAKLRQMLDDSRFDR